MNEQSQVSGNVFRVNGVIYFLIMNALGMNKPTLKQLKSHKEKNVYISHEEMQRIKNYNFSADELTFRLAYLHFVLMKLNEREYLEQLNKFIYSGYCPIQELQNMEQSLGIVITYTDGVETFKTMVLIKN